MRKEVSAVSEQKKWLPCPYYRTAAVETWLHDEAAKGWFLKEGSAGGSLFVFTEGQPKEMTYRLEPVTYISNDEAILDGNGQNRRDFLEEMGWHSVGMIRNFEVFTHEGYAELHTSPEIEAAVKGGNVRYMTISLLRLLLNAVVLILFFHNGWLIFAAEVGAAIVFPCAVLLVLYGLSEICSFIRTFLDYLHLKRGGVLSHHAEYRKSQSLIFLWRIVNIALPVLLAMALLANLGGHSSAGRTAITDEKPDVPFMTIRDIDPEAEYVSDWLLAEIEPKFNTFYHKDDVIFCDYYDWCESAYLRNGEERTDYFLMISYYGMKQEWAAEEIRRELSNTLGRDVVNADGLLYTEDENGFIICVFRRGNTAVKAVLHADNLSKEELLAILRKFADSIGS